MYDNCLCTALIMQCILDQCRNISFFRNIFLFLSLSFVINVNDCTMKRPEIVQRIADAIKRVAPEAKTILYGSEARGEARPDSDIDLLVLLEGDKRDYKREDEIITPLYEIELETGVIISPMMMLRKDWENRPFRTPFYINVVNEGIVL